jgi:ParB-like chromosome segregation protein Spo0J
VMERDRAYHLVCGHRRVRALAGLLGQGMTELPPGQAAISSGKLTVNALVLGAARRADHEAVLTGFIDNYERLDMSPYENAVCFKELTTTMGYTRDELCARLKIPQVTMDYMIAALNQRNLPAYMIQAWKQRRLSLGHVIALVRLRHNREAQRRLCELILDRRLSVRDAEFWCNQLLENPDSPLESPEHGLIEQSLLGTRALRELIDSKRLRLSRSRDGERLDLSFKSAAELRQVLTQILASLRGLP